MKPLIAITSDFKHVEPYNWHATPSPYVDATVQVADAMPVIVPSIGEKLELDAFLDRVDGVLITGSRSNVHPSHYQQEATSDHEPFDPARDATTLPLIRRAIERGIPLLAICRGIQELNVALGGSITPAFQKNRAIEGHGYPWEGTLDERFSMAHPINVKPDSCIADILREELANGAVKVNSLHTQALDRLGHNIVVEATAADGTVEAVTVADAPGFVVGVQWHPEYWAETDNPSNTIFKTFGAAARNHMTSKFQTLAAAE
ncbi:MAG: gamma-glutamyl-gamma-aminobutyrate hydrolase family protein [Pseudomonadota bacterium]